MACTLVARNTFWVAEADDELPVCRPRCFSDGYIVELASSADLPECRSRDAEEQCASERTLSTADSLSDLGVGEDLSEDLSVASDSEDLTNEDSVDEAAVTSQWLVLDTSMCVQWVQPMAVGSPAIMERTLGQAKSSYVYQKKRRGCRGGQKQKMRAMLATDPSACRSLWSTDA